MQSISPETWFYFTRIIICCDEIINTPKPHKHSTCNRKLGKMHFYLHKNDQRQRWYIPIAASYNYVNNSIVVRCLNTMFTTGKQFAPTEILLRLYIHIYYIIMPIVPIN